MIYVLKDYKKEKKLFGYVIDKAKKIFLDVFGYELKEVKKGKDGNYFNIYLFHFHFLPFYICCLFSLSLFVSF